MSSSSRDHAPTITGGAGTPAPPISDAEVDRFSAGLSAHFRLALFTKEVMEVVRMGLGLDAYQLWVAARRFDLVDSDGALLDDVQHLWLSAWGERCDRFEDSLSNGVGRDPRPTVAGDDKSRDEPNQLRKEVEG